MYYQNILETIGNTPLVKLNKVTAGVKATVLAKIETFNPGNSIKDRMAVKMIEDAEAKGLIRPGGTIIEGTSGNTGMGLALACIVKGYKLICTMPDKQSKEKMDILRAVGAEVVVTPTDVEPEDPRSYYSVARRLSKEIPNAYYPNQYDNLSNTQAHYESTGPEIWEQTEGKITHLVVGVGTGGTISGVARYLKEKNPSIKVWGIDTYGSVFKKYKETGIFDKNEIYSYLTEGIGEDILPANVSFDLIDHFEKVSDKDGMLMTRDLARKEGIFVGNSAGSAVAGLLQMKDQLKESDTVVVIFHDHGSRYVGKIFNDDWMRDRGFLDKTDITAKDLVMHKIKEQLITVDAKDPISEAIKKIMDRGISQVPVTSNGQIVGALTETQVFSKLLENPDLKEKPAETIMLAPFPFVDAATPVNKLSSYINKDNSAVLVKDKSDRVFIITKHDIIQAIAS
jgi:cystathionine beta-synthase